MSAVGPGLREAMSHFATGVAVIAARDGEGNPCATTVNALTSVSLDPPLILVCLGRDSVTLEAIRQTGRFSVNVLAEHQDEISTALARRGIDAELLERGLFAGPTTGHVSDGEGDGVPLVDEALAHITCETYQLTDGGDHEIVIGRVVETAVAGETDDVDETDDRDAVPAPAPLLFFRSRYSRLHAVSGEDVGPAGTRPAARKPLRPVGGESVAVDVAIIGGGVSGTLMAVQLLRRGPEGMRIALVESRERVGPGVAYGTDRSAHLLNVPAVLMNALPDEPGHFLQWAKREVGGVDDCDYLPRQVFGHYIEHVLAEAERAAVGRCRFDHVIDEAVGVRPRQEGYAVRLAGGGELAADSVVLAAGNALPADPAYLADGVAGSDIYIRDPWQPGAIDRLRSDDQVLVLGTALTMVDVALALGHAGGPVLHAVSRTGLMPRAHLPGVPYCGRPVGVPGGEASLSDLTTKILAEVATAESGGGNWRHAFDSLRPISNELWLSLSREDRHRFFDDGLVRVWSVHRHRMAPGVGEAVSRLIESRRLRVHGAQIRTVELHGDGARVEFASGDRGDDNRLHVDHVINCTGPVHDPARIETDLFRDLVAQGLVDTNEFGVGIAITRDGRLIDSFGRPHDSFYGIGPMRFGTLLETTAVAEIGQQAAALAGEILGEAKGNGAATAARPTRPDLRSIA